MVPKHSSPASRRRSSGAAEMQAAYAEHGQIVIKDVAEPTPGPGLLLVAVKAAGLNAADRLMVNGSYVRGATTRQAETADSTSIPLGADAAGEGVVGGKGGNR